MTTTSWLGGMYSKRNPTPGPKASTFIMETPCFINIFSPFLLRFPYCMPSFNPPCMLHIKYIYKYFISNFFIYFITLTIYINQLPSFHLSLIPSSLASQNKSLSSLSDSWTNQMRSECDSTKYPGYSLPPCFRLHYWS